jgi:CHAT domain-containing protein
LEAAVRDYARVLSMRRRALGPDAPLVAWSLNNLAAALEAQGDLVEARARRRECLAIRRRILPPDHVDLARALRELANDDYALGEFAVALRHERAALAIYEKHPDAYPVEYARVLSSASARLRVVGRVREARDLATRALAIRRRVLDPANPEIATSLLSLGRTLMEDHEVGAALDSLREALAIRSRLFGARDPRTALVLDEIAKAQLLSGQEDSAVATAREAIEGKQRGLGAGHPDGARSWRVLADAQASAGDSSSAVLAALECERIMREHLTRSVSRMSETDALSYEATRVSGLEVALRLCARSTASRHERLMVWDAVARSRARVLDQQLARRRPARREVGIEEVLAAVPRGTALVSVVRCAESGFPIQRPARYVALCAVSGDSAIKVVDLGPAAVIDDRVVRWRTPMVSGAGFANNLAKEREAGLLVRRATWDPIQRAVRGAQRVVMVLDGALHDVDLYALPREAGGFVVEEDVLIERLGAEREWVHSRTTPTRSGLLLAVVPELRGASTPALPEARREVQAIAERWVGPGSARGKRRAQLQIGRNATAAALTADAAQAEVIHIAAHGVFAGAGIDPERDLRQPSNASPDVLGRSGLLLHADQAQDRPGSSDLLTPREIAAMDLSRTRWVVLSGCETGRGQPLAREGVIGTLRAFQVAGARVVLSSLWPVSDRVARRWMEALYEGAYTQGLSVAEATRAASRECLASRRRLHESESAVTWAAFIATGIE